MTTLETIITALETATGYKPVVKGGNRLSPIEYTYSRVDRFHYTLQIYVTHKDLLETGKIEDAIYDSIVDFYDNPRLDGCSVEPSGYGNFENPDKGNLITTAYYFDVTDYQKKGNSND